jgi:hypothetical protein
MVPARQRQPKPRGDIAVAAMTSARGAQILRMRSGFIRDASTNTASRRPADLSDAANARL